MWCIIINTVIGTRSARKEEINLTGRRSGTWLTAATSSGDDKIILLCWNINTRRADDCRGLYCYRCILCIKNNMVVRFPRRLAAAALTVTGSSICIMTTVIINKYRTWHGCCKLEGRIYMWRDRYKNNIGKVEPR